MADSPLQKAPSGLLGAFDLKTQGLNPERFSDSLQGVYDCLPFYLLAQTQIAEATDNVQFKNDGVSVAVPAGQIWRVLRVTGELDLFAGEVAADGIPLNISLALGTSNHAGAAETYIPPFPAPNANGMVLRIAWNGPELIGPGGECAFNVGAELSQPETARIIVQYQAFDL